MVEKNIYEQALETYEKGRFLQLEGSYGRYFVNTFIESGILKFKYENFYFTNYYYTKFI